MNYGTIYTLPFRSRKGDSCLVEIQKEDYTGQVTELTGSGEAPFPLRLQMMIFFMFLFVFQRLL